MSSEERNRALFVYCGLEIPTENVEKIMEDLERSGMFTDLLDETDEDWFDIEKEAAVRFSDKTEAEKKKAIDEIKKKKKEEAQCSFQTQYLIEQEQRVIAKRKELIAKGIVSPDDSSLTEQPIRVTRYGRTPLHEAIAMRDIELVKKYIKRGQFIDVKDNNDHTPLQMAFYEDYTEAIALFKAFLKKNKK
jgi:hypothetical protein